MNGILKSIRGRIFLWLFIFTSLLLTGFGFFLHHKVKGIVFGAVDTALQDEVQEIAGVIHEKNGESELELTETILAEYATPLSGHHYEVLMDGRFLAASPSLADRKLDFAAGRPRPGGKGIPEKTYTFVGPGGEPIRVLQQDKKVLGKTFSIFAAQDLGPSIEMVRTFRNFLFLLIFSGVAIVCLTGFWIAKWSLNPLHSFSGRIQKITHKTLGERIEVKAETQEVSGLADAFNGMLDRLQRVFESERRFIADASHELKTPVSVLKAQCDVILQRERRVEEYIVAIESIRSVSDNIGTLIRDLLSLSRLDSGILSPEGFTVLSVNECIRRWADMVSPLAAKRGIRVVTTVGRDVTITGDRGRLNEAFLNIMENGLKYNRENGLLDISATAQGGNAVVSIKDTGVGIKECDRDRIFDRFYRSDTSRSLEGTGLGLSIARMIIEAHGGCITIESEPGLGSTFTVTLPAHAPGGEGSSRL